MPHSNTTMQSHKYIHKERRSVCVCVYEHAELSVYNNNIAAATTAATSRGLTPIADELKSMFTKHTLNRSFARSLAH